MMTNRSDRRRRSRSYSEDQTSVDDVVGAGVRSERERDRGGAHSKLSEPAPGERADVAADVQRRARWAAAVSAVVVAGLGSGCALYLHLAHGLVGPGIGVGIGTAVAVGVLVIVPIKVTAAVAAVQSRQDAEAIAPSLLGTSDQQRSVLINLSVRQQAWIDRIRELLNELVEKTEEPNDLDMLFRLDHFINLYSRNAENLGALFGEPPQRQTDSPEVMYTVLRSAVCEIEHYARIKVAPPDDRLTVHGHAFVELVHLLSALLENATAFSKDDEPVGLSARACRAGVAIEVEDRGDGLHDDDYSRLNALLADPGQIDLGQQLGEDGRTGLAIVAVYAHRLEARVELRRNNFGGTTAVVVVPQRLLGTPQRPQQAPAPAAGSIRPSAPPPVDTPQPVKHAAVTEGHRAPRPGRQQQGPPLPKRIPDRANRAGEEGRHHYFEGDLHNGGRPALPVRTGTYLPAALHEPAAADRRHVKELDPDLLADLTDGTD